MKKIILALSALTFIACGKVEEDPNKKLQGEMKDVTDQSFCQGPTPVGLTVFNKTWRSDYQSANGPSIRDVIKVEPSALTLTRTCIFGSAEAAVVVRANASVNSGTIQTLSNDSGQLTIKVGDSEQTCYAAIQAGQLMSYSFQGPCLKTVTAGTTQVMIPQ